MSTILKKQNGIRKIQYTSGISQSARAADGYCLLAIEIVRLAAEDYRKELEKSKKDGVKTKEASRLERFFRSNYGQTLSFGKGEYIIRKIQEEIEYAND